MLGQLESILFVASKPLSIKQLAKALGRNAGDIEEAIETLKMKFNREESGIHLFIEGDSIRMGTNPDHAETIEIFVKDEVAGELTKAQLETLTVIAYRGPITRPEIEQIRGVNCAVILRNLLMRGLIEEEQDDSQLSVVYRLSHEALSHLGITSASELSEYETLSSHEHIETVINE